MRPSTCLKSRPTTALICTRTSPAASNHVKSTSANQIETRDVISSFLAMQLNTLESHANSRNGQILVFFSSFRTHHTHFLTYTTPTDTWAHQLCLLTSLFARQSLARWEGWGGGVWFSAIAALGPLTHTRRRGPSSCRPRASSQSRVSWLKPCTTALIVRRTRSYCKTITFTQLGMQLYW